MAGGLSARDVESMASEAKSGDGKARQKRDTKFVELEKNLGNTLKAPVVIQASSAGGRIVIRFATLEDLNKIAKTIID